jgi:hypothetical protein
MESPSSTVRPGQSRVHCRIVTGHEINSLILTAWAEEVAIKLAMKTIERNFMVNIGRTRNFATFILVDGKIITFGRS